MTHAAYNTCTFFPKNSFQLQRKEKKNQAKLVACRAHGGSFDLDKERPIAYPHGYLKSILKNRTPKSDKPGVYIILCGATQQCYLGESYDMGYRLGRHERKLKLGKHTSTAMQALYKLHANSFEFAVLVADIPVEKQRQLEEINLVQSNPEICFNIFEAVVVDGRIVGHRHSPALIEHFREKNLQNFQTNGRRVTKEMIVFEVYYPNKAAAIENSGLNKHKLQKKLDNPLDTECTYTGKAQLIADGLYVPPSPEPRLLTPFGKIPKDEPPIVWRDPILDISPSCTKSGIFVIINTETKQRYYGQAINISNEISKHRGALNNGTHDCKKMLADYQAAPDMFQFMTLYSPFSGLDTRLALELRLVLDCKEPVYNSYVGLWIDGVLMGVAQSQETKDKLRDERKGVPRPKNAELSPRQQADYANPFRNARKAVRYGERNFRSLNQASTILKLNSKTIQKHIKRYPDKCRYLEREEEREPGFFFEEL
jgi:hypothetical protein